MINFLLYALLSCNAVVALWKPWVGVVVGYVFAIFGPQFIWFWAFEGVRPVYYAVLPTLSGFGFAVLNRKVDLRLLKEPINICMLLLWAAALVSYACGPYVNMPSRYRWFDPGIILNNLSNIFIFYFVSVLLLDEVSKLKWASLPILMATCYLIYWANEMYFSGYWYGRLSGPSDLTGSGPYIDENVFAMLFVTGLPFVYYLGWFVRSRILRILVWLIIPLGWHAIFLTGSRGGLVGLGVIVLVAALRSPKKFVGFLLVPLFVAAFFWQGGPVMKERVGTISDYQKETSAQTRLEAWEAGLGMILKHPITGVGVASFGVAFPDFSDKHPRAAHNTLVQIAAEWGVYRRRSVCSGCRICVAYSVADSENC